MDKLIKLLRNYVEPNDEELHAFTSKIELLLKRKDTVIQRSGVLCSKMYFIEKGYVKYTMKIRQKDIVVGLASDGDFVSDYYGYFTQAKSITTITAISDCTIYSIEKSDLEELYDKYKIWERFGRLVAEEGLLEQIMERLDFQTKSPAELYLKMLEENRNIFQHVSLGDIAGSLGITQESLSRIRNRIRSNN